MDRTSVSSGNQCTANSSTRVRDPKTPRSLRRCSHSSDRRGTTSRWNSTRRPDAGSVRREESSLQN